MGNILCLGCMQEKQQQPVCELCGYDERRNNQPHQLPVGTYLNDHYLVGKVLGQGGFGITYAGWDNQLMIPVAIKEYYPSGMVIRNCTHSTQVSCSGELTETFTAHKERFLREARILAQISSVPEIVQVKNHFFSNNTAYTIMEYVRGTTLKEYLRQRGGKLSVAEALAVMEPVILALEKVHKLGLIHRDISPDNIMLPPEGGVKLIDFGTARFVENADTDNPLSKSTESILKHGFAPMEQYQSRGSLGPWTDVYALCCTIYYCMTGKVLMDAPTRVSEEEELNLKALIPELSAEQAAVLEKGLAVRAKNRIHSMAELHSLLYSTVAPKPLEPVVVPPIPGNPVSRMPSKGSPSVPESKKSDPPAPGGNAKSRRLPLLLAGLAALICLVSALFLPGLFRSNPGSPAKPSGQSSGSDPASGPVQEAEAIPPAAEISLWTYPIGRWSDEATVNALLKDFHDAYPTITVTVQYLDYLTGDDHINASVGGEMGPDIVLESPERLVAIWGKEGLMADLSDCVIEDTYEPVLAACTGADGAVYTIPLCMNTHCMGINRDVFEAAGAMQYLNEQTQTWNSTEDFYKAVEAVSAHGYEYVGLIYCLDRGGDFGTRALITNLGGGAYTNADHTAYTYASRENAEALSRLCQTRGIWFDPTITGGDEAQLFVNGTIPMAFCWNASLEAANSDELSFEVLPVAFPSDTAPALCGSVWGFGVFDNGDADRLEAAKLFIRFMTEEDAQYRKAVAATNYFPVRDLDGYYDRNPLLGKYALMNPMLGDYYQIIPGWNDARKEWWNMLQSVTASNGSADAILVQMTAAQDAANAAAIAD